MYNLSEKALNLWGKKNINDDHEELWLPLIVHLIDTKNVINWLYNHWLDQGQRNILCQNFESEEEVQNLVKFVGYIHDIGKATPAFQTKRSYIHDENLDTDLLERLIRAGFNNLDHFASVSAKESPHNIAGEVILEKRGLNKCIGAIIGGHHGKPVKKNFDYDKQYSVWKFNYLQYVQNNLDYKAKAQENWNNVQDELIDYGLNLCDFSSLSDVPKITQAQAVIIEGLVIMADWLASSEYLETDDGKLTLFPLIKMSQSANDVNSEQRFENAIINWKSTDKWEPDLITDGTQNYQKRWHFSPRAVQAKMTKTIDKANDPGMIIVEAPMGIGKTEIALTAVEQLAFKTGRNSLFFGLPTQATANAMFSRVDTWLSNISKDQGLKLPIKLMHGKAQFNSEYESIPHAENVAIDEDDGAVVVNSWFSGKKSILTDFTIGTVDQLLFMALKQKHLALRHLGLSGKIVVIDEVHAYDVYMNSYLKKAIEWLGAYHVPVIALSATLPVERRNELLAAYAKGKYGKKKFNATGDWKDKQSYPLLSILDGNDLKQVDNFDKTEQKTTKVEVKRINFENEELINRINSSINDGGVAGVIVNTVKRAQALARIAGTNLPSDVRILVLHSAFLANERTKIEEKLQSMIGKDGQRPEKLIVIGTQVLEQSLDIDFDVLYTDIAPMDLLLQRAGRMHRHKIKRPENLKTPRLYVMGINDYGDYGDANEYIYQKYLLMKTDHFLPETIVLPDDISDLVQKVYSSDTDDQVENIMDAKDILEIDTKKAKAKAKGFQLAPPARPNKFKDIHGWLDNGKLNVDKDENRAQATVRDIQESIEVILLKHVDDHDYLLDGTDIGDLSEDSRDKIIAQQLIRLPHAVTQDIDQAIKELETITSEYYPNWQTNSVWLRGSLALPLDEKLNCDFNGYRLHYSSKLGLSYEKIES
ncbi:CRISPR-associated helicase/endonuclease Cas3 [Lactobacillus hamsteri]|uniref:CRISPR-associated helicase, cas3 n=1 Tax=Lactobacillus hamsteri DSM 5661 = JCM 6256 TaxID=1423754 RepID=A0A0R1Y7C0_9LACO|nr:CRISPR-associated helicase/endonuclease Cas3 [Lactobacillus hamsteri]KRM38175.1 CRISPR-associated helicase, cas3 [Lactobacillus hamsteri DSM 5661 = JCM 6256]